MSVPPVMIVGTSAEPSHEAAVTRASESHSGVSIGDAVAGSSFDVISTVVGEVADRVHQHRSRHVARLAGHGAHVDLRGRRGPG